MTDTDQVSNDHVMKDPEQLPPEHAELTRKFLGCLMLGVIAVVVALAMLAVRYGATDPTEQLVLLVVMIVFLAVAAGFAVAAVRFLVKARAPR